MAEAFDAWRGPSVQLSGGGGGADDDQVHAMAAGGVSGTGGPLPFGDVIQTAFGAHDVSGIRAHTDPDAGEACDAIGATAYATGSDIAFGGTPDLHTSAHEAAHVVQQRAGVQLRGGVGARGDAYEQEADAVADRVVAGESAAPLLAHYSPLASATGGADVQKQESPASASPRSGASPSGAPSGHVDEPVGGDNRPGFIDSDDGANIRTRPAELAGSETLTPTPLPPATQVYVSGRHPQTAEWLYVTAFLPEAIVRGYVQGLRVATDLPEPTAKLYQVKSGDTAEALAVKEFASAIRDGHDLRYYENVLLFVNREAGRAGVRGSFQDPGLLGGGANNVQLEAGRRIWLPSPAYARALEGVVPDGSLTNGAVAKVKRFAGHLEDILASVTESWRQLDDVAGEYGQAIHDHMAEIIGIVAGFIMAEALSAFLAATPTGVGQIAAVMIQLALAVFGAHGMAVATVQAGEHAINWLSLAWTANGKDDKIAAASREFIRMLVSIAMAALAYLGVKGNISKANAIADSIPTSLPAFALAEGVEEGAADAAVAVKTGVSKPSGPVGNAMAMSTKDVGESEHSTSSSSSKGSESVDDAAGKQAAEKAAAEKASREHVHSGGIVTDPQSPYFGKWDRSGIHDWDQLEAMCKRDGFKIKSVTEDPATGARRVEIERYGTHPKTGAPVKGVVEKTIYPKRLTAAQIDEAGEAAFESALKRDSGTKLDPVGLKQRKDGSPADGYFEATVKAGDPPRDMRIQGWYKKTPAGENVVTSHAPMYRDDWPAVDPKDF